MKARLYVLAVSLGALSFPTMADSWFYGGASAGVSEYKHENALAHTFYLGTNIIPWIGIEGGYADFGRYKLEGGHVELDSVYGAIKPHVDFGPLELYAKGGVQSWVREGFDDTRIEDDDDLDSFWGIGANYSFMGPISLGLEYSNYKIGNDSVSMLNATASISLF